MNLNGLIFRSLSKEKKNCVSDEKIVLIMNF